MIINFQEFQFKLQCQRVWLLYDPKSPKYQSVHMITKDSRLRKEVSNGEKWCFLKFSAECIKTLFQSQNPLLTRTLSMTLRVRAKVLLYMWSYNFYDTTLSTYAHRRHMIKDNISSYIRSHSSYSLNLYYCHYDLLSQNVIYNAILNVHVVWLIYSLQTTYIR